MLMIGIRVRLILRVWITVGLLVGLKSRLVFLEVGLIWIEVVL